MTEQQQYMFSLWEAIGQFMPDFYLTAYGDPDTEAGGDYTQEYLQQQGYPYSDWIEGNYIPGYDWEIWKYGGGGNEGFGDYDWLSTGSPWTEQNVPWANLQFLDWIEDFGMYLPSTPSFEEQNKIISNANLDELSMYIRAAQQDVKTISNLNAISDFTDVGGGVGDVNVKLSADAQLSSINRQRKGRRNWRDFYDDLYSSIGDIAAQGAFTEETIQDLYSPTYSEYVGAGPGGSTDPYEWQFGELPTYEEYCNICPSCCD